MQTFLPYSNFLDSANDLDRQRLGWHDRASATRLVRLPPR